MRGLWSDTASTEGNTKPSDATGEQLACEYVRSLWSDRASTEGNTKPSDATGELTPSLVTPLVN